MTWMMVAVLAVAAFAALAWLFKAPRAGWEAIGAALLFGLAGFALQARVDLPGSPRQPAQSANASAAALVEARKAMAGQQGTPADSWTVIADAFSRNGQFGDAAGVIRGAIEKNPANGDAWLALGNNLVAHADGALTPAALYAYGRAQQAAPDQPGPPFFLGLALAQNGRLSEARQLWADLLARSPGDAPWRKDLTERLGRLDRFIAEQKQ